MHPTDQPSPAADKDRLLSLLERWQDLQQQGTLISPAELCADCPELVPELEKLARFAGGVQRMAVADSPVRTMPTIAGYEILSELGRGGMGVVYKARHLTLNRLVALKMLLAPMGATADQLARFRREATTLAALQHPNIVQIFDVGEHQGCPYLAMELVEGGSLESAEQLAPAESAKLVRLLAKAMAHVHARGVIHRDLKPSNILLAPPEGSGERIPKIGDFGLALRQDQTRLTQSDVVVGTIAYLAPEQAGGGLTIGPPADVWALGVILYRLLAGREPFTAGTLAATLHRVVNAPMPPLDAPAPLAELCRRCLSKRPEDRPTAEQLSAQLDAFLAGAKTVSLPISAGRSWATMVLVVVAVIACLAVVVVWSRGRGQGEGGQREVQPAQEQDLDAVLVELKRRNPGFDGRADHKMFGGSVYRLEFLSDKVTDIAPLANLQGLRELDMHSSDYRSGKLKDIRPLRGLALKVLSVAGTEVEDLTPLAGMNLTGLNVYSTPVRDLSVLHGMEELEWVFFARTNVTDLSPLERKTIWKLSYHPATDGAIAREQLRVLRTMRKLENINDLEKDDFWKHVKAGGSP